MLASIAYCGPAALPENLWTRWNGDPLLIAALVVLAIPIARGRAANVRAGWGVIALLALIFVSPLCALSSALFSARVFHHVLLIAAVAPLFALAFPMPRLLSPPLAVLVGAHAAILWFWHAPGPYAWGLASVPAYWLMQTSILASAWFLWRGDLCTGDAIWLGTRRVGRYDRSDGTFGCFDRFCTATALRGAFFQYSRLGIKPTCRSAVGGPTDVGTSNFALPGGGTSGWPGQACGQLSLLRDHLSEIPPSRGDLSLVGWIDHSAVLVLAASRCRERHRTRSAPPSDPIRLCGNDLPCGFSRYRQRNGTHLPADHIS